MKRKLKCYMAYTTFVYRLVGVVLIPCVFWLLCAIGLWLEYGWFLGGGEPDSGEVYGAFVTLSAYVLFYELFTDYWVLGGCFSETGKGLKYFKTSHCGAEAIRNVAMVDLLRRFLYCMILSVIFFAFTGWKPVIVMGLAMYCMIAAILNGSRHIDGLQRHTGIVVLAQIGMVLINILNFVLLEIIGGGGTVMFVILTVLYGVAALCVSYLLVWRIAARVRKD